MNRVERGFTIIEVVLFLAISGMLVVIAFAYTSSTISSIRFKDGSDQLISFFQQQYLEVKNVNVSRPVGNDICDNTTLPGTTSCYMLGKVIIFTDNKTIKTATVVGTRDVPAGTVDDYRAVWEAAPRVLADTANNAIIYDKTFEIPWQGSITSKQFLNGVTSNPVDTDIIAIIRSPISERVMVSTWDGPAAASSINASYFNAFNPNPRTEIANKFAVANTPVHADRPVLICVKPDNSGDERAVVQFSGGRTINTITGGIFNRTEPRLGGSSTTCL